MGHLQVWKQRLFWCQCFSVGLGHCRWPQRQRKRRLLLVLSSWWCVLLCLSGAGEERCKCVIEGFMLLHVCNLHQLDHEMLLHLIYVCTRVVSAKADMWCVMRSIAKTGLNLTRNNRTNGKIKPILTHFWHTYFILFYFRLRNQIRTMQIQKIPSKIWYGKIWRFGETGFRSVLNPEYSRKSDKFLYNGRGPLLHYQIFDGIFCICIVRIWFRSLK